MKFSRAFTIIELVFVIVVLGILASIALPKLSDTVVQADLAKGRGDVATIRTAIANERQSQVIRGETSYIPKLSSGTTTLFTGDGTRTLLMYGIAAGTGSGNWQGNANGLSYTFTVGSTPTTFIYNPNTGTFTCTAGTGNCDALVN
jgi:general secretion pathway protein G